MDNGDPGPLDRIGEGATQVAVGPDRGRIVMIFQKPTKWLAMDPANAVQIAKSMIDTAVGLGLEVSIELPKKQINAQVYWMLVRRVELNVKNLLERKMKPQDVAREIVDIILSSTK